MTEKQQQFLWIVQTAILVNVTYLAIDCETPTQRADVTMTGNWDAIAEAIRASSRIPADMDVETAANEYCSFMLSNQKRHAEEANGPVACPWWFARSAGEH